MQADQSTLIGQAVTGIVILAIGGFIAYKIIRALAAFADALQGGPEPPTEDEDEKS